MATDPFTQVYDVVWTKLNDSSDFTGIVTLRRQINLSGTDPDPYRDHHATSDFPEAILEPGGYSAINPWATSSGLWLIGFTMNLLLATGDKRVDQVLFPLTWAVIKALHPLKDGRASGISFLQEMRLTSGGVQLSQESNAGWISALSIEAVIAAENSLLTA